MALTRLPATRIERQLNLPGSCFRGSPARISSSLRGASSSLPGSSRSAPCCWPPRSTRSPPRTSPWPRPSDRPFWRPAARWGPWPSEQPASGGPRRQARQGSAALQRAARSRPAEAREGPSGGVARPLGPADRSRRRHPKLRRARRRSRCQAHRWLVRRRRPWPDDPEAEAVLHTTRRPPGDACLPRSGAGLTSAWYRWPISTRTR